ncbi:rRNA maturation RNase YbeY [Patescibacteria group bacterium]|nr:rRNA maturation RNase YbeY [Patescibacteria group bacterium]
MAYRLSAYVEPHYPLKRSLLTSAANSALISANVKGKVELAVSVIGNRKMRQLNREYRKIDAPTDVLAFSYSLQTGKPREFITPPSNFLNLGDVVISYPQLLDRAAKEETMVDEMAQILTIHGVLHLLGYNHEKPQETVVMESLEDATLSSIHV